jgi:hypothetical protein
MIIATITSMDINVQVMLFSTEVYGGNCLATLPSSFPGSTIKLTIERIA